MFSNSYNLYCNESLIAFALNYAPRLEDVWVIGGMTPRFLTSVFDGYEWSALLSLIIEQETGCAPEPV
jgi:hypothetical protein